MKRVKPLLDQKDRELLQKFQINKKIKIKLGKLQANVNTKTTQKVPLIFTPAFDECANEFGSTHQIKSKKRKNKRLKCHMCPYSSANKSHLNRHLWTHSAHKRFKCDKCSFEANEKSDLQYHTISKHNTNPESRKRNYQCQLCSKSFFRLPALRVHLSVHTQEKPFSCQFCRQEFTIKSNRNRHEIICIRNPKRSDPVWVESQNKFQCKLCSKKMLTKSDLVAHIRNHTQEKPYKCDKCDYAGALASALRHHVERRHNLSKIKNFACELCLKGFVAKAELYQHIRTHTKETWSACEFCKKQFAQVGNQNRHEIICKLNPKQSDKEWVSVQKKFKCEVCEYSSTAREDLKKHVTSHTGNKPFKCTFCPFKSTTQSSLYRHVKTHTKESLTDFPCVFCSKQLSSNQRRKQHQITCKSK